MRLTSAVKRHLHEVEIVAIDLASLLYGLTPRQQIDVLKWALYGRDLSAATGVPTYTPTDPKELSDEYTERCYEFADKRGANSQ